MMVKSWHGVLLGGVLCAAPAVAGADDSAVGRVRDAVGAGTARLQDVLARHVPFVRKSRPDWILEQDSDAPDPEAIVSGDIPQLVLQESRRDGTDMLTLRYPLGTHGPWRAYAGAGLSQVVYYGVGTGAPELVALSDRERVLGAAAEFGAELRLNSRLMMHADLRWADLHENAVLLKSEQGLVGADALSLGVSVGWRFR